MIKRSAFLNNYWGLSHTVIQEIWLRYTFMQRAHLLEVLTIHISRQIEKIRVIKYL